MKFDLVKSLLAVALSAVLALICYKLGMEEGSRNWIAFIFTFFGAVVLLLPALGMDWSAYCLGGVGAAVCDGPAFQHLRVRYRMVRHCGIA